MSLSPMCVAPGLKNKNSQIRRATRVMVAKELKGSASSKIFWIY